MPTRSRSAYSGRRAPPRPRPTPRVMTKKSATQRDLEATQRDLVDTIIEVTACSATDAEEALRKHAGNTEAAIEAVLDAKAVEEGSKRAEPFHPPAMQTRWQPAGPSTSATQPTPSDGAPTQAPSASTEASTVVADDSQRMAAELAAAKRRIADMELSLRANRRENMKVATLLSMAQTNNVSLRAQVQRSMSAEPVAKARDVEALAAVVAAAEAKVASVVEAAEKREADAEVAAVAAAEERRAEKVAEAEAWREAEEWKRAADAAETEVEEWRRAAEAAEREAAEWRRAAVREAAAREAAERVAAEREAAEAEKAAEVEATSMPPWYDLIHAAQSSLQLVDARANGTRDESMWAAMVEEEGSGASGGEASTWPRARPSVNPHTVLSLLCTTASELEVAGEALGSVLHRQHVSELELDSLRAERDGALEHAQAVESQLVAALTTQTAAAAAHQREMSMMRAKFSVVTPLAEC